MPILDEKNSTVYLPRISKLHLGVKVPTGQGDKTRPKAEDHFVFGEEWLPEVLEAFGTEQPRSIPVLFPSDDEEIWCSRNYLRYNTSGDRLCKGNGQTCTVMIDEATGAIPEGGTVGKKIKFAEGLQCLGTDCGDYDSKCVKIMSLQFIIPTIKGGGLGVWQLDSKSINGYRNIRAMAMMIRLAYGTVAMVPNLFLTLEQQRVMDRDRKKRDMWILNLRSSLSFEEMMHDAQALRLPDVSRLQIQPPVEEYPDLLHPSEFTDELPAPTANGKPPVSQPSLAGAAPPVIDEVPAHEKSPEEIANAIAGAGAASQSLMEPTTEPVDKIRAAYEALLAKENAEKAAAPEGEYNPDKDYGPTTTEAPPAAETITDWEHFFPIAFKITGEKSVTPVAKLLGLATIGLWKGTKDQALDELQKIKGTCDWRDM